MVTTATAVGSCEGNKWVEPPHFFFFFFFSVTFQAADLTRGTECLVVSTCRCQKGVCIALDGGTYRCDCQDGYSGALCNLQVAPTMTVGGSVCGGGGSGSGALQCLHGRCERTEDGGGRCVCEPGFSGESCSIGEEGGTSARCSQSK